MTRPGPAERWPAPAIDQPVRGSVRVPGSKSVTNRALVLAALADAPSRLRHPLRSRDTELMAAALGSLGAGVTDDGTDWVVTPAGLQGGADIDVGLAGTVMRFVPPAATLAQGAVTFDGDPRARERPMSALITALQDLGATVHDGGRAALPLTVVGRGGLPGGAVEVDASSSSQIVSALMLTGARWDRGVQVVHVGSRSVPNAPHLQMTVSMLRDRDVTVEVDGDRSWTVAPGPVSARDENVEPDLSSAAPFLAAAVVTAGAARVRGWPTASCQPGAALPDLLARFGANATMDGGDLVVTGPGSVSGADLDLRDAGELTPVLAAIAAVASTPSTLRGVGYLRGHETDRLAALARELTGLGARVTEEPDGLRIEPGHLAGGTFRTYADHRLAMAAAVIGLVVPGVVLDDVSTTAKTFPGFAELWSAFVGGDSS